MSAKGIGKFIAYKVTPESLKQKHQKHYDLIMADLQQTDDLRILGYNGHRIFEFFNLQELGEPIYYET